MTSYRRSIATIAEINGDFSRKSQIFPPPCILRPDKGVPLGIGYRSKTRIMGLRLPGRERSLTISSAVWIQYTNVTDWRTDTGRQQRPRFLRTASRGNNVLASFVIQRRSPVNVISTIGKLANGMLYSSALFLCRCLSDARVLDDPGVRYVQTAGKQHLNIVKRVSLSRLFASSLSTVHDIYCTNI